MRACTILLLVLLIAALLPPINVTAQSEPAARGWWSRVFQRTPARPPQTIILRDPGTIMRQDQRRETILEQTESARRMATDKQRLLLELRSERDRRVAGAIASAAADQPFRPPENTRLATAEPAAGAPAAESPAQPRRLASPTPPSFTPGERSKTVAERTAETVDRVVDNIGQKVFNTPAAQPLPPGLYALALIGMFLVPAMGVGLILIGFAHLRGHSFVSGSIILAIGGLLLWGTWSLAKTINPDLLSNPARNSPAPPSAENASPIDSMRSDLFWSTGE